MTMTTKEAFELFKDYADALLEIGEDFAHDKAKNVDVDEVFYELQAFFTRSLDGLDYTRSFYE